MFPRATALMAGAICAAANAQPVNDTCATAIPISPGASVVGTTVGAAADGLSGCDFFSSWPDVYYAFTATEPGLYTFDTVGSASTGNTLAVYPACPVDFTGECDTGSHPSGHAVITRPINAGQTVYIAVAHDGAGQPFTLNVSGPVPPPSNDECANAITLVENVPFNADNLGATTSMLFDDGTDCNSTRGIFSIGADDVFFSFTPAFTSTYDISTCGSDLDTVVSIHSGCPATPANAIACFDEFPTGFCADDFRGGPSVVPGVSLQGGVTYTIRVAGLADRDYDLISGEIRGGRQGAFQILVTEGASHPIPPANDDCANATPLTRSPLLGGNIYATGETAGPCTQTGRGTEMADLFDVWYSFTATAPGTNTYAFTVTPATADTGNSITLALFDSCDGPPLACLATEAGTAPRRLAAALNQGQTVLLRVAGLAGAQLDFMIDFANIGPAPANRDCAGAQPVSAGSYTPVDLSNAPSTTAPGCDNGHFDINGLWYTFTATEDAFYRIAADHLFEDVDTELLILDACDGQTLACVSDADPLSLFFGAAATTLFLETGDTIYIRAAANVAGTGEFELEVSEPMPPPPPPINDDCANATDLFFLPFTDGYQLGGAGNDPDTDCNDPALTESIAGAWYTVTPAEDCLLSITAFSQTASLTVTAFTGQCGALTEIGCVLPTIAGPGSLPIRAGTTYYFLIHVADGAPPGLSAADLYFECAEIPENDTCDEAELIEQPGTNLVVDITNALADGEASCINMNPTIFSSVWYTFTTGSAGELTIHNDLSQGFIINSVMALYTGGCGTLNEVTCAHNDSGSFFPLAMYDLTASLEANTTYHLAVGARFRPESMINDLTFNYTGTFAGACAADLDGNSAVDVFDLLAYLDLWFAADAGAERTGDSPAVIDVFDLLVYLDAWFAGCP